MAETTARITYNEQQATQGFQSNPITNPLGSNREDLGSVVWDVSPTETPGLSAMGKTNATGIGHDWITDALERPSAVINEIEGADATITRAANRERLSNYSMIISKTAEASGTQEKVLKGGGIKSELAYQTARRIKEMKQQMEAHIYGGIDNSQYVKILGAEATARQMGGFVSYMSDGWQSADGAGTPPTGDGTDVGTPGGPVAFSEDIFKTALTSLWDRSGGTENPIAIMGSFNRGLFSTFEGSSSRYVTTDDRRLTASIDVYDGDYHTVTATPDRFCATNCVFIQDNEYIKLAELRPMFTQDLAVTGDSRKKQVLWEATLEVCNPDAHQVIVGTTTAG